MEDLEIVLMEKVLESKDKKEVETLGWVLGLIREKIAD